MAAGTPVVASNSSSIPEVGGDAPAYFAPHDIEQAAASMIAVLTDRLLRETAIKRGKERAMQLDWQHHFEKLCDCYRRLLE
jgi:glycosyltransferase involved in cell wall biosynthesis